MADTPAPQRIQRKREKGWRVPKGAVYVGRPTQYGNPFVPDRHLDVATSVRYFRDNLLAPENAERLARMVRELRGRDLMCWCPLDRPCHADVLLELANVVTRSRTDRQPPNPVADANSGYTPVGPDETKQPDLVTHHEPGARTPEVAEPRPASGCCRAEGISSEGGPASREHGASTSRQETTT